MNDLTPICPYCGGWSAKVSGTEIYPHRPDLGHKTFYACRPCDAYVGCHDGTDKPLGSLADRRLRRARRQAHDAFDNLWRNCEQRKVARSRAYSQLAEVLEIDREDCHIGRFDEAQCERTIEAVKQGDIAV